MATAKAATPRKATQKDNVLAHLQAGARNIKGVVRYYATITPLEALSLYGAFRLSAIIYDLKDDGYRFKPTKFVTNEHGNQFGQYQLA